MFDSSSRAEWTACTGYTFKAKDSTDRPTYAFTPNDPEPESDAKERMQEQITLSYSWEPPTPALKVEIKDLKAEEKRLDDEGDKIPKDKIKGDVITKLNELSYAYIKCVNPDPEELGKIPPLEARLVQLDILQLNEELHDSYWESYDETGTRDSRKITKSSPWFYSRAEKAMNVTTVRDSGRRLEAAKGSFKGDDFIMLNSLRPNDRPTRLTTCVNDAGNLAGFQVFYGDYDEIAGSAHGDLTGECTNTPINQEIWKVIFYGDATDRDEYIVGMEVVLQPFFDEEFPGPTIQAGRVAEEGQEKRTVIVPNNKGSGKDYIFHFFGFTTNSKDGLISDVSVITYDKKALFRSLYDFPALDAAEKQRKNVYTTARAAAA